MATPSIGNRFVSGRRNAAKEQIEAWMQTGDGTGTTTRLSGQLPKNITEAKMLHSNLLEMSKQRYNYIKQSQWEQKRFLEAQRKKTAVMKDLLKNVDMNKVKTKAIEGNVAEEIRENSLYECPSELEQANDNIKQRNSRSMSAKTTSTKASKLYAFVTERGTNYSSNQSVRSFPEENFHKLRKEDDRWPVKDMRFTKLYKSLSDVYIPLKVQQSAKIKLT